LRYPEDFINKIICGNTLSVLKTLPDESVNCVVTSPPYWGLRDYGIEPVIWDGDKDCKHEWGNEKIVKGSYGLNKDFNKRWGGYEGDKKKQEEMKPKEIHQGNFCLKCGAWRGSLGLEPTFELYIKHLCDIFDEVKRVSRKDGTCWVNLGDSYGGTGTGQEKSVNKYNETNGQYYEQANARNIKNASTKGKYDKCLMLIPQRFAIEMVNRGWILRNTIIWKKPNCMPSSAKDRFTVDFEYVYFFVKSKKYWFEQQIEIAETNENRPAGVIRNREYNYQGKYKINNPLPNGNKLYRDNHNKDRCGRNGTRNKRAVWTIPTKPFPEAHFAVYPEKLIEPMIKAGCPKGGIVLDPFMGAGTTAVIAKKLGRKYLGIEIKQEYIDMANKRIRRIPELLF